MDNFKSLILCLLLVCLTGMSSGQFSGGTGTLADPYKVANAADLNNVRNNLTSYFKQTENIDLLEDYPNWLPIAGGDTPGIFTGQYDGGGFTISNLKIDRTTTPNVGLFSHIGQGTQAKPVVIKNVHLVNVNVAGARGTGSLVGRVTGNIYTLIEGCSATGIDGKRSVTGDAATGGLVGSNNSETVTPGGSNNPVISRCYSAIDVFFSGNGSDNQKFGSLVGCNQKGTSIDSYARGNVTINHGTVNLVERVGGLAGCTDIRGNIIRCFSTGLVTVKTGTTRVGGLVGNIQAVQGTGNNGVVTDSYWDTETSGQTFSAGGFGRTPTQMKEQSTFVNWDFNVTSGTWQILLNKNDGYPSLQSVVYTSYITWTGTTNTDWNTLTNWSPSGLPKSTDIAVIPAGVTNFPSISGNNIPKGISIAENASLKIPAGTELTLSSLLLNSAGPSGIVIESDATSTESRTGSLIFSSQQTQGTLKRYIEANRWYLLSGAAAGQDISGFLTANSSIPQNSSLKRGMMDYNTGNNQWNNYFDSNTPGNIDPGKGYAMRTSLATTVNFAGTFTAGEHQVAVSRNDNTGNFGWNLIGNPYTSAIRINEKAGADNFIDINSASLPESYTAVYVWNETSGNINTNYTIINHSSDAFNAQVGQAFFVKAATGATQVSFSPAMQLHKPTAGLKSGTAPWPEIRLTATMPNNSSSTSIRFDAQMTTGLDIGYDAGAFKTGFDVYTRLVDDNGVDFALQCLPMPSGLNFVIPVGIDSKTGGEVVFTATREQLPHGSGAILEDRQTGAFTDLSQPGSFYTAYLAANTLGTGRFFLHTSNATTAVIDAPSHAPFSAVAVHGEIRIYGHAMQGAIATLYDLQGRRLFSSTLSEGNVHSLDLPAALRGVYLLSIIQNGNRQTVKLTAGLK